MQTNVFLGSTPDPLLGGNYNTPTDYDARIAELQAMQQRIESQRKQVGANASQSPTWDEIERITAELSDSEFALINQNEDFQKSQADIMAILQREQMRIMRPIVENTQDGKQALDKHLALVKRLRKEASSELMKNLETFNDYTQNHSDITFAEYLRTKTKR